MLMRKQLARVKKQFADQTFLRWDKTDGQSDLDIAQKRVDAIKHSCQTVQKKITACLQGFGQDVNSVEKRKKKMPAFLLANCMQEGSSAFEDGSVIGAVLNNCSPVQNRLADELLNFELQVEKNILSPLNILLENDIPNIVKMRKQLNKLNQDTESAKTKYETAVKHCQQTTGSSSTGAALAKAESFKEEYEELSMKVEQQRDSLAAEMFALISREAEFAHIFVQFYHLQADYHSRVSSVLEVAIPQMKSLIMDSTNRPAYGCQLEEHLRVTNRQISFVLEKCIAALLAFGMNEEGLFRIAGSASKLKKLKSSFDAGIVNMTDYATDPHSIAGALKSYLRQLPEPLLTHALYDDWMNANKITEHDSRLQTLWQVVNRLPELNFYNLRYLIKFLAKLTSNSETNKMNPQNLAIVMAPNLIWPLMEDQTNHIGMNMTVANIHSSIVDSLVSYADYFFPGEVDFVISPLPLPHENIVFPVDSRLGIVNTGFSNGDIESEKASSPTSHSPRVIHRPGKKPAPPAPGPVQPSNENKLEGGMIKPHIHQDEFPGVTLRSKSRDRSRCPSLERTHSVQESDYSSTIHRERLTVCGDKSTPILSRSATLDRPGKPKRSSLSQRQSHDNLANLIQTEKCPSNTSDYGNEMIRKNSSEKPPITFEKPAIQSKSANISHNENFEIQPKVALAEKASCGKPDIPAKPPSLDNVPTQAPSHVCSQLPITIRSQADDSDTNQSDSRRSSEKDSIHFADESDNEETFQFDISTRSKTPISITLVDSKDDSSFCPPQPRDENSSDQMMGSFSAKMEKKWAFLTNQAPVKPPERPPRIFPLSGSHQSGDDFISAPIPGSFIHVNSQILSQSTNAGLTTDLPNHMTASTHSLPGNQTNLLVEEKSARLSSFEKRAGSSSNLLDENPTEKEIELNGKISPVPTVKGAVNRPPRPQPPPPPNKPRFSNVKDSTRL